MDFARWLVTGGSDSHLVDHDADGFHCRCPDAAYRGGECKHRLAVRLRMADPDVLRALRMLVPLAR
jgi:hypothetical protein